MKSPKSHPRAMACMPILLSIKGGFAQAAEGRSIKVSLRVSYTVAKKLQEQLGYPLLIIEGEKRKALTERGEVLLRLPNAILIKGSVD